MSRTDQAPIEAVEEALRTYSRQVPRQDRRYDDLARAVVAAYERAKAQPPPPPNYDPSVGCGRALVWAAGEGWQRTSPCGGTRGLACDMCRIYGAPGTAERERVSPTV